MGRMPEKCRTEEWLQGFWLEQLETWILPLPLCSLLKWGRLWKTQVPSCVHCQMSWWPFLQTSLEFRREDLPGDLISRVTEVHVVWEAMEGSETDYGEGPRG